MKLLDFLRIKVPTIEPEECKLHLACYNGEDDPFDVYVDGEFDEWQSWQTKRNFERDNIIALIQLPGNDRWLFAGLYSVTGSSEAKDPYYHKPSIHYKTKHVPLVKDLEGRLVVLFKRSGRQSYLNAERWMDQIFISELKQEKMTVSEFDGYNNTCLTKCELDTIVSQDIDCWRGALANVSGVYLITDTKTGKLYVGSATGSGGIWQRWTEYSTNLHGNNKGLKSLLRKNGKGYAENFQYSILEIADTHTSVEDVLERESYWKDVLCSREHGYNEN